MNRSLQDKIEKINNTLLNNIINEIENNIIKLDDTLNTINSNNRLRIYLTYEDVSSPEIVYLAYEIIQDLGIYINSTDSISDAYLIFQNNVVFTHSAKITKKFLLDNYSVPINELESLIGTYIFRFFLKSGNDLYYINSLPLGNRSVPKSLLLFRLNIEKMRSIINANMFSANTSIFVIDSNGMVLFDNIMDDKKIYDFDGINDEYSSNESKNIVSIMDFNNSNWKLVSITPEKDYSLDLIILQKVIFYILLTLVLIGIAIAFYFAFYNYKNVARIIEVSDLDFNSINHNIFSHIENNIKKTIDENMILKNKLTSQTKYLNNNLIEQIIKKKSDNKIEIEELIKLSGISIVGNGFIVLSIKLDKYGKKTDYVRLMGTIRNLANEEKNVHVFFVNTLLLVILVEIIKIDLFYPNEFSEEIKNIFTNYGYSFTIGIGDYCEEIYDINRSYLESLVCISSKETDNNNCIIEFSKIKKSYDINDTKYFYSLKTEHDIIKLVKSGDCVAVSRLLDLIYDTNFKELQISSLIAKVLINDIISTLLKVLDEINVDITNLINFSIINSISNAESSDESFKLLEKTFLTLTSHINKCKKSHNQELYYKIDEYIKQNYADSNISLDALAGMFDISISYLSRFFKEQSGVNFNSYIHTLRVEKAKLLLFSNSNLLISEVALKVGYNTTGSFIRAFQKFEGITPGEFKLKSVK